MHELTTLKPRYPHQNCTWSRFGQLARPIRRDRLSLAVCRRPARCVDLGRDFGALRLFSRRPSIRQVASHPIHGRNAVCTRVHVTQDQSDHRPD